MYAKQFTNTAAYASSTSPSSTYSSSSLSITDNNNSSSSSMMLIRDWRKALRGPPSYRIISSRQIRSNFYIALVMALFGSIFLLLFYIRPATRSQIPSDTFISTQHQQLPASQSFSIGGISIGPYNYTYPLTEPIFTHGIQTYRIGLIADLDQKSKDPKHKYTWRSYYLKGHLSYTRASDTISIQFDKNNNGKPMELSHSYSYKGRGMELSELVTFNGRLLTFDDRTGLIYELINDDIVVPWIILMDGNGKTDKGFKSEWATVKDKHLYVGSMGKEWTTSDGDFQSYDPMYVKVVNVNGEIQHLNWMENYKSIRAPLGIEWPGYMIHESGMWSDYHNCWFFLPRRCSKEKYNETRDEMMGCNVLLSANEDFTNVRVTKLENYVPSHGYSSFKFVPGSENRIIVALQTEELNGRTATYITAFTIDGRTLLAPQQISNDLKYEGFEFI